MSTPEPYRLPTDDGVRGLAEGAPLAELMATAAALRDAGHGGVVSFSKKVFIPLTKLCRDVCHYCVFAETPKKLGRAYLTRDEVLDIARRGAAAGCKEALFTLGDKPELRYGAAREELAALGHATTLAYLAEMCRAVFEETGLLPHVNPGIMERHDIAMLREVSVSQGIMLESSSRRLMERGEAHFGSPDKDPAVRLATIAAAGELRVPFTSGILIGIGETKAERLDTLLALRDAHAQHGHLQEIIVQNFLAKPGTRMARAPEPSIEEHLWTIAMARIVFGPAMSIQAPPNLRPGRTRELIDAGIDDFGGISPVTPDHVNPEAPWPQIVRLAAEVRAAGKELVERLAVYPPYVERIDDWVDAKFKKPVLAETDATGLRRADAWAPGGGAPIPAFEGFSVHARAVAATDGTIAAIIGRAARGMRLDEREVEALFATRGRDLAAVCRSADELRADAVGDTVTYVVNRNINYTNVCYFHCKFCAFSKSNRSVELRGTPYDLSLEEIQRRVGEAWERGATEVCLQGGIHPDYTGDTYLEICRGIKTALPAMHVHAFSPLEIWQGAKTLGLPLREFLTLLKAAGLSTLPGTAAEILHDEVRAVLCPDKITTAQWLEVMRTAHEVGLRSTATIMFGHVDRPRHWAAHLLAVRDLQERTGGFTEFVPLPFVHMEAPIYLKSLSRTGPTFREAVLMHAVARLALSPLIPNIQTSWVKMGRDGAKACLDAGANDLGGSLMNESITRAAGAIHGQEFAPPDMEALICGIGRRPVQRTTLYDAAPAERRERAMQAGPLSEPINMPASKKARIQSGRRQQPSTALAEAMPGA